jgi:septum formation protein
MIVQTMTNPYSLILASNSPRRQQLLRDLGFEFIVKIRPTEEVFPQTMPPVEVPSYLATQKAEQFRTDLQQHDVILCADTIVVIDDEILNKPANESEARIMLKKLSGQSHQVITGICVMTHQTTTTATDIAQVYFRKLTDNEIDFYINTYKPYDKAGGYGVQEWIGMIGIERLEGSYYTIMGLPVHLVYKILNEYGVSL